MCTGKTVPEKWKDEKEADSESEESEEKEDAEPQPGQHRRKKSGSSVAGKVISALLMSASSLAGAAHRTWTSAIRYNRVDFAEISCAADSQQAGEIITRGGTADRYSHWNGFDLTTHRGATSLRDRLEETQPRWV